MVLGILFSLSLVASTAAGNSTRCFECTDVPHPADCTRVTECSTGQICYVEQFITTGGLVLYNSGCLSALRCTIPLGKKRDTSRTRSLSGTTDISACVECCNGEFCNNEGCNNIAVKQPLRGPLCFSCDLQNAPEQCRTIARCDLDQVCTLTEIPPNYPGGYTLYSTRCQSKTDCEHVSTVGKKRNSHCHVCCKEDFCNDNCSNSITTVATTTASTITASTTTTSSLTTTTTTTPITTTTATRQTTTHSTVKTTLFPPDHCFGHHLCFRFHYQNKTWKEAEAICKKERRQLAVISSSSIWDRLKQKLQADHHYQDHIFIGGRDLHWQNGHRVTFADWGPHQPSGRKDYCMNINVHEGYKWNEIACNYKYPFICSKIHS